MSLKNQQIYPFSILLQTICGYLGNYKDLHFQSNYLLLWYTLVFICSNSIWRRFVVHMMLQLYKGGCEGMWVHTNSAWMIFHWWFMEIWCLIHLLFWICDICHIDWSQITSQAVVALEFSCKTTTCFQGGMLAERKQHQNITDTSTLILIILVDFQKMMFL